MSAPLILSALFFVKAETRGASPENVLLCTVDLVKLFVCLLVKEKDSSVKNSRVLYN